MLFQKTKIVPVTAQRGALSAFPMEHLLFTVENGSGQLRPVWYDGGKKGASPYDSDATSALMLGDRPLLQIQSSGCPTCESLLAAGHGLPEDSDEFRLMAQGLSAPYVGLEAALDRLRPLLALLPSGAHVLTWSHGCPTDGDGHFFWNVPQQLTSYLATAAYFDIEQGRTFPAFPCFFYPTQGAHKYDAQRVEHYRALLRAGTPLPPVLAYALDGYMCALLDGHHRACACALEGASVPCLILSRPARCWMEGVPHVLWPDGGQTKVEGRMSPRRVKQLDIVVGERRHAPYPFDEGAVTFQRDWEPEYGQMAAHYPTCYDAGALALYPEIELNAQGIRKLAMDDDYEEVAVAAALLRFAARRPGTDKKALALPFVESGYPTVLRKAAFEVLDSIKGDAQVDELMISILVNCERKDDPIYRIADQHWETETP